MDYISTKDFLSDSQTRKSYNLNWSVEIQGIIRASPTLVVPFKHTFGHKITDVVKGCVCRTFADFRPFTGGQFAEEAVKLHIDDFPLALVDCDIPMRFPKP